MRWCSKSKEHKSIKYTSEIRVGFDKTKLTKGKLCGELLSVLKFNFKKRD